jgi:hypothetical protein
MPISIARKLQAFKVRNFPEMHFQMRRVALRFHHVRNFQLPGSPLKDTESRADPWRQATGLEQTEVDAMVQLHPQEFEQIITEAMTPFFDFTLARRVNRARTQWLREAQALVDAHVRRDDLEEANQRLADLKEYVESEIAEINTMARDILDGDFELPEVVIPEAQDNSADASEPLIDSEWEFISQCRRLIVSKREYLEEHELPSPLQ